MGKWQRTLVILLSMTALSMLLLSSCSVEKKLGKEFQENWVDSLMLVLPPDYLFKNNLKTYDFPGIDTLPEFQRDSILLVNSLFLKHVNDSLVLNEFTREFVRQLKEYQFEVLEENKLDSFMVTGKSGLFINIAQVSLEEFVYPYSFDYDLASESVSVDSIDLNALSFNVWVEVSRLNSDDKYQVLFASDYITDNLEGYFRQFIFSDQIQFEFTIDTLNMVRLDSFSLAMGKKTASYLFDYYMNNYILDHVPKNYPYAIRPLHWDTDKGIFEYAKPGEQFIEVEQRRK